ncbi:MAG: hypothetical protein ACFFDH_22395 [Promethearchaeota archaeon]
MKNLIKNKKLPNQWAVGPLSKPKDSGKNLEKYQFSNIFQQAGMAVELNSIANKDINKNELNVKLVDTEESLIEWSYVVSNVFNLKINLEFLKFLLQKEEIFFYIGKFNGKSISTLLLYLSSGVAGLHAISTLQEDRGRGFGFSISRSGLIDAFNFNKDYYIGVLQALSLGEFFYRKLGFQKYCDIISYSLN